MPCTGGGRLGRGGHVSVEGKQHVELLADDVDVVELLEHPLLPTSPSPGYCGPPTRSGRRGDSIRSSAGAPSIRFRTAFERYAIRTSGDRTSGCRLGQPLMSVL